MSALLLVLMAAFLFFFLFRMPAPLLFPFWRDDWTNLFLTLTGSAVLSGIIAQLLRMVPVKRQAQAGKTVGIYNN